MANQISALQSLREVDGTVRMYFDLVDSNRIVASCYVENWNRPGGWIMWVHVTSSRRRQGLATQLLQAVIEAAKQVGKTGLALSVRQDNLPARRLYNNLGFVLCHTEDDGNYLLTLDLAEREMPNG